MSRVAMVYQRKGGQKSQSSCRGSNPGNKAVTLANTQRQRSNGSTVVVLDPEPSNLDRSNTVEYGQLRIIWDDHLLDNPRKS